MEGIKIQVSILGDVLVLAKQVSNESLGDLEGSLIFRCSQCQAGAFIVGDDVFHDLMGGLFFLLS